MEEIRDMVIKVEGMVFVPNLGQKHVEIYEIGNRRGGFGIGGGMCYEVSLVVFDWEDVFIVKFQSDVVGNKCIQCLLVFPWDGDVRRLCQFLFLDRACFRKMLGAKVVVEVNLELIAKED